MSSAVTLLSILRRVVTRADSKPERVANTASRAPALFTAEKPTE